MENSKKNSLLGQLEARGILNETAPNGEYFPFGMLTGNADGSPFSVQNNPSEDKSDENYKKTNSKIIKKRLNDLDYNIFQEGSFLDIKDLELENSEKIKKIKKMIKTIDKKIFMLEDFEDEILLKKLKYERAALKDALGLLTNENETSKTETLKELTGKKPLKEKIKKLELIIFGLCPVLRKNFLVRKALNKLVMLNESAKNLSDKQIPYGEREGRYNDFIACLSCANVIHAKLTKKM